MATTASSKIDGQDRLFIFEIYLRAIGFTDSHFYAVEDIFYE